MKVSRQVIMQGLKQTFCIPLIYIKHGFRLPKNSQCSKVEYRLPFDGEWTVVNGGLEKEYSHSWGVPTQRYAYGFIGHLQPQSICVEVGEKVQAGQVIAKCGNTGNSSEPHVHFHVQDGANFFTSAGIPICFKDICVTGQEGYSKYDSRAISEVPLPD